MLRMTQTMGNTALELSKKEWQAYRPDSRIVNEANRDRLDRAWELARTAADMLRERFGANGVVVFGSLAHDEWFTRWSDIDLAAWGIPPDVFFRAVAAVTGLSAEFRIDLVDPRDCRPALRQVIEREGVPV
jgi:predicted nucleotidyltransferase